MRGETLANNFSQTEILRIDELKGKLGDESAELKQHKQDQGKLTDSALPPSTMKSSCSNSNSGCGK